MKIVIAGGTGFIGQKLTAQLLNEGHQIIILTREPKETSANVSYVKWLGKGTSPETEIEQADVFINLAGVSINKGRWTKKHQKLIYESRLTATAELVRMISKMPIKPNVLINASAIGIYPASNNAVYTEDSIEIANDFLGKTVSDWERKAKEITVYGVRSVLMRFGMVLGKEGGALPLMALPYRLFVGGKIGTGEQWISWVHEEDVVRALVYAIENEQLNGPVNVVSPSPIRMNEFGKTLGSVLERPHWIPVPSLVMKFALGRKSSLILDGQQVLPKSLLKEGFEFRFTSLRSALEDIFIGRETIK